jgi:S-adenosylmethionine decarboxylase
MKKTKRSLWAVKKPKKKNSLGTHLIADFWFGKKIENPKKLERLLIEAAKKAKSTPLKTAINKFNPKGISGVLLLSESHISWHSWPEYNYLAIDIFTCGEKSMPERALKYFKKILKPKKIKVLKIQRGNEKKN